MMKAMVLVGQNFGFNFWDRFCEYGEQQFGHTYSIFTKSQYLNDQFIKHKKSNVQYHVAGVLDYFYPQYGTFPIDKEQLTKELRQFEEESGFLIADIIQADRNLGRGFYHAGHARPKCKLSKMKTYWDTQRFIYEYIRYFNKILDEVKPDVLLIGGGSCVEINTLLACTHRRNIPVRRFSTSRYKNNYYWSFDAKESLPYFSEYFQNFIHEPSKDMEIQDGYKLIEASPPDKKKTLFKTIKKIIPFTRNRILSYLLKLYKRDHTLLDTYYFESVWVWFFREYFLTKKLRAINKKQTLELVPQNYCYYPLHIEPEDSLCVCAPEFNNQLAVIDTLAKNLPSGVVLAIKEHPHGISMRPPGFYEYLQTIPNVYIASLDMSGPELARNSLFTATITGTSGLEASVCGVPVIALSPNILYTNMKHVHVVTDFMALRKAIDTLCRNPQDREDFRIEGQRYLQALCTISMDFGDESIIRKAPSDSALQLMWDKLQLSLKTKNEILETLQ